MTSSLCVDHQWSLSPKWRPAQPPYSCPPCGARCMLPCGARCMLPCGARCMLRCIPALFHTARLLQAAIMWECIFHGHEHDDDPHTTARAIRGCAGRILRFSRELTRPHVDVATLTVTEYSVQRCRIATLVRGHAYMPRCAGSLTLKLIYGIAPAKRAKTELTMCFLVESYP